jgi:hypothetical protein
MRKLLFIILSIHILKLEISGCDNSTPLKGISSHDSRKVSKKQRPWGYYPRLINFPHIVLSYTCIPNMLFYPP